MNEFIKDLDKRYDFLHRDMSAKEAVKRWEKYGFLEGIGNETVKICIVKSYDDLVEYVVKNNYFNGKYEFFTVISFPLIRRVIGKVTTLLNPEKVWDYIMNTDFNQIYQYLVNGKGNVVHYISPYLKGKKIFEIYNIDADVIKQINKNAKGDIEAEIIAALSDYIIDDLK
jgi:hypothetical protein